VNDDFLRKAGIHPQHQQAAKDLVQILIGFGVLFGIGMLARWLQ
jgi:hypothetical protein